MPYFMVRVTTSLQNLQMSGNFKDVGKKSWKMGIVVECTLAVHRDGEPWARCGWLNAGGRGVLHGSGRPALHGQVGRPRGGQWPDDNSTLCERRRGRGQLTVNPGRTHHATTTRCQSPLTSIHHSHIYCFYTPSGLFLL